MTDKLSDEAKEAQRLIDKFGSYATDVAKELKLLDQYNNTYFGNV